MGSYVLAAAPKSGGGFGSTGTLLVIVVIVAGFYMLMIRPQRRRQQQVQQQQKSVQPGARVRTTAGMYATVVAVDGDDVILEVAPDVEVRYMKRAIMEVVSPGEEPEDTEESAEDSYDDEAEDSYDGHVEDAEHVEDEEEERPAEAEEDCHRPSAQAPAESGSTAKD